MHHLNRLTLTIAMLSIPVSMPLLADEAFLETLTVTANAATKTNTPFIETPQAISVIERNDWEARGAESVQRAADYTPGVFTNQIGASNRYDYLVLRGFADGSINNTFLDGLNVMSDGGSFSSLVIDPWFLDNIEIVKGPTSVLYGRASPGGLIAQTSRRPEFTHSGELRLRTGNNAQRSAAFDLTGPVNAGHNLAFRLTGLARTADTQFGPVKEERYAIAPQLTWTISDATSLTLHAYLQHEPEGGYHSGLPYEGTVTRHAGQRVSNSFFEGEKAFEKFKRDQTMIGYELEHYFSDTLIARQLLRYSETEVELAQVYAFGWASDTELNRYFSGGDESMHTLTVDNQIEAQLATGAVDHTLLMGIDYQRRNNNVLWASGTFPTIDAFNPQYGSGLDTMYPAYREKRELEQTGLYLQDQLSLGNWHASLGLRHDWVEITNTNKDSNTTTGLDDTQFSGRAGLLYRFDNGIAPYLSYSTSFSPNSTSDQNSNLLAPTKGEQKEVGLKYQPTNTKDHYSVALFDITQKNISTKLPNETFYRATGKIQSRGVELEAYSQLTNAASVRAGYSYTDVTLKKTNDANQGNKNNQSPRHQVGVWGQYAFQSGALFGLDVGLGVRYHADMYADEANTEKVPNYTLVDASIGYDLGRLGLKGMSAQLNAANLLNKEYVASCYDINFCYFGAERNVTATLNYTF